MEISKETFSRIDSKSDYIISNGSKPKNASYQVMTEVNETRVCHGQIA
jgi:hypothetical protein